MAQRKKKRKWQQQKFTKSLINFFFYYINILFNLKINRIHFKFWFLIFFFLNQ